MKNNLLPNMTPVRLLDRDGEALLVELAFFQWGETVMVFIGDGEGVHRSVIARNTAAILAQLIGLYDLDVLSTTFVRHIVAPSVGSTFGRFNVDWRANEVGSYTFKILHNLDEELSVRDVLREGIRLDMDEISVALAI